MERALNKVQADFERSGKGEQFTILKPWLVGDTESLSQNDAAGQLGMKTGAVKVAIYRLRRNFGDAVRTEIAQTVDDPNEVSEELRYLIEVLS